MDSDKDGEGRSPSIRLAAMTLAAATVVVPAVAGQWWQGVVWCPNGSYRNWTAFCEDGEFPNATCYCGSFQGQSWCNVVVDCC